LINFLQTLAVAATVNVQWTEGVLEVFETSEYIGVFTTSASSGPIDCLISSDSPKTRSITRMLLTILVPSIVISIFLAFWSGMTYKSKQNMMYFWKRVILSIIAVTYISYLGLTQLAVRVFYCVDVHDSTDPFAKTKSQYWAVDTAVTCYGKAHGGLIAIGVVVLLFVSFGFPLASALLLTHTKAYDQQSMGWQLETMGFLYRAFKEKFVYWESVVMLRKALLSVIVVFSYPLGGQIQGLLAALVLIFGLYFHQKYSPFRQEFDRLNHYESLSLLVSCVTFMLGQFFNVEKSSDTSRTLIAVVIIVANTSTFAILVFVLIVNVIEQLRETLQNTSANISQDTPWWKVLKVFITSKLSALCGSKK